MKTEIIVILILVQVVASIFAKRKAKKQAEASGSTGARNERPAGETRKREAIADSRSTYDKDESGDQGEWDEHHMRGASRDERPALGGGAPADRSQAGARAPQESGTRNPAPGKPSAPAGSGRMAEAGKDLLSQLAKELGLEIPAPPQRKPPAAAAKAPAPSKATTLEKRSESKRIVQTHTARPVSREGGENAPRRAPGNTPVTQAAEGLSVSELARESLGDAASIRRAFILKTILDKPLSLQPRRPGQS